MLDPVILAQILWTGIATSAPYVLMTVGFALTLKVTGLWNFAHAGLMAIAFYTMYFVLNFCELPVVVALGLALVVTGAASLAIEVFGLRVLRERGSGNLTFFIFTLILSEFLIYVITLLFGAERETLFKSILSPVSIVGDIAVSDWDVLAVLVAAGGLALLYAFLTWSREGQFLNAVADNARLAELYGISANRAWASRFGHLRRVHRRVDVSDRHAWRRRAQLAVGTDHHRGDRNLVGRHRPGLRRRRRRGVFRGCCKAFHSGHRFTLAEFAAVRRLVRDHSGVPARLRLPPVRLLWAAR